MPVEEVLPVVAQNQDQDQSQPQQEQLHLGQEKMTNPFNGEEEIVHTPNMPGLPGVDRTQGNPPQGLYIV